MSFPRDYFTARDRFRAAAAALGWPLEAHPVGARGPDGDELTIDVAASAPPGAERVVIVSSGIHGVEGPFGSAVQTGLMEEWRRGSAPMTAVRCVFVHALNPYGFAWSRRSDEGNVDPNRNFLLDGDRFSGSPASYSELDPLLNPRRPPSRADVFFLRTLWAAAVHGVPALRQAVAIGQYDYPHGLFFGGQGPSPTRRIVESQFGRWVGGAARVMHLDLHTGLGRWGRYKLLIDYDVTTAQREQLDRWFGREAIEAGERTGPSYRARGSFGPWCVAQHAAPEYVFAFAEFGTYGNLRVLAGLRAENQADQWAHPESPVTARAKARLRELFCPADPAWRSQVLAGGMQVVRQAIAGLAHS